MKTLVNVIIISNGVVEENILCQNAEQTEEIFLKVCARKLSNFEEYSKKDVQAILDQGYENFGNGSICINHPELA